jgi:hypothetical protein
MLLSVISSIFTEYNRTATTLTIIIIVSCANYPLVLLSSL